ncbi:MSHA biogenesis protein MshI [Neptunicella marina]|uniref:MSHA biogenesis protein MshI n=1 Tax=Neptunicella marina TaxID=2125989 RepID=A0A8J6LZF8_9ALTE|nr:MSHA biogenesis protein MshI [Neptunicella marina]MBC3766100.1 MSHA biogenesis protein MshI [Neptunicella marina]
MHLGWRALIKQYFQRNSGHFKLGIEVAELGIHISVMDCSKNQSDWSKQHFIELNDWPQKLKQWVLQQGLQNSLCNLVIDAAHYQIYQVEKPSVPQEELAQALRWSVKDLLVDSQDVVLDYYEHPAQTAGANKVSVVAVKRAYLDALIKHISQAGLALSVVSIEEMAFCELLPAEQEATIVLSQNLGQDLHLYIIKQGKLYFNRKLRGYNLLSSMSLDEMRGGMLENLATEIQRSMDYFESQLHQAPVTRVGLVLDTDFQQEVAQELNQLLMIQVEPVAPSFASQTGLTVKRAYFTSLGAASMSDELEMEETHEI